MKKALIMGLITILTALAFQQLQNTSDLDSIARLKEQIRSQERSKGISPGGGKTGTAYLMQNSIDAQMKTEIRHK